MLKKQKRQCNSDESCSSTPPIKLNQQHDLCSALNYYSAYLGRPQLEILHHVPEVYTSRQISFQSTICKNVQVLLVSTVAAFELEREKTGSSRAVVRKNGFFSPP